MIGLAVYLNGKKLTTAGADDLSMLHAMVAASGPLGKATRRREGRSNAVDLRLTVGGLTGRPDGREDEHLRWIQQQRLRVGDRISVRIVRATRPSKFSSSTSAGGNMQQIHAKRRELEDSSRHRASPTPKGSNKRAIRRTRDS